MDMKLPTALGIELFNTLLKPHVGPHKVVLCYSIQILTQPGDNYGSTMLSLTITLEDTTTKATQTLSLVAKLVPPVPLLSKLINVPVTFCKEVDFYRLVVPAFRQILSESGICSTEMLDTYPQFYGSRLSANRDSLNADNDAILLLENLKVSGYQMCNRFLGLDLKHTELTLSELARFHALSVALKIKKPDLFYSRVMKTACEWSTGMSVEDSYAQKWMTTALNTIKSIPECVEHIDKVRAFLIEEKNNKEVHNNPTKPFATLIHNDFWTNNIMFHYKDDPTTPTSLKILDFQLTTYDSPVRDIVYFLYTSTGQGVRENNLEHFLQIYHSSFTNCLQKLNCEISNFSFERFIEEFNTHANLEFSRMLVILKVMCAESENLPSLLYFEGFDHILDGTDVGGTVYKRRVKELVLDFVQNGWL